MKMGKNALLCVLILLMLLTLPGCMVAGEDYLAPPGLPVQYRVLQDALDDLEIAGYASAQAGAHRQPVQMVDLDNDGTEEAVVFASARSGLCRVHVLQYTDEVYNLLETYEGFSSNIYEVRYPQLTADGRKGIAVVWGQPNDASRGITVIAPDDILTFACQSYLFQDSNGDGTEEIWYVDQGLSQWTRSRLNRVKYEEGDGFRSDGRISLASEAYRTVSLRFGLCDDETPAVFADSYTEDGFSMVTDLVVEGDAGLFSLTQQPGGSAAGTLRRTYALCTDINGDGLMETPVEMTEISMDLPGSDRFIAWYDFSGGTGEPRQVAKTFYMNEEGVALGLFGDWYTYLEVTRWKDEKDRTVYSFYDISPTGDEGARHPNDELLLRLCFDEAYKLDEMEYEHTVILEGLAVGFAVREDIPGQLSVSAEGVRANLHLLQDRW